MFDSTIVFPAYKNLLGWRQHHDADEFQILPALTGTETGEVFQQKHPALQLDIIKATLPPKMQLDKYLEEVVKDSANEMLNDLIQYRQLSEYGKTLLDEATLLNRYGWKSDLITNRNRFVGVQIKVKSVTALKAVITEIGMQLSSAENLDLYLFHSSKVNPITTIPMTTVPGGEWTWKKVDIALSAFKAEEYHGGVFILGYYQDDLAGNAINYTNFNWDSGECGTCNNSYYKVWRSIRDHFHVYPIYVPDTSYVKGEMPDLQKAIYTNSQSWGLNFKFSVRCDLTGFFVQNKFAFKNLLALKVVNRVLMDMKFSQQINSIEENIKMMIIRDLEGDVETKSTNIPSQYNRELKAVSFNISGINSKCLGCLEETFAPSYGVVR